MRHKITRTLKRIRKLQFKGFSPLRFQIMSNEFRKNDIVRLNARRNTKNSNLHIRHHNNAVKILKKNAHSLVCMTKNIFNKKKYLNVKISHLNIK